MRRPDGKVHTLKTIRSGFSRRHLLTIGVSLGVTGCSSKGTGLPTCVSPADGAGAGFCLVVREQLTVGGAASLEVGRALIVAADDNNAAIVARDALGFYALSATCRHQCCTVTICDETCARPVSSANDCAPPKSAQLVTSGAAFLCPCHGSTYAADGAVLSGPSLQPLSPIAMRIVGTDILVDLSRDAKVGDRVNG